MQAASSSPESNQITRRQFSQKTVATAGAATLFAPNILRGQGLNEKLNIAIIGAGGRGGANTNGVRSENIVALCDVNQNNLNAAASRFKKAKTFTDFRKLYEHQNDFDAVVVSTCEHTHAFATLPALQLGKHVYCEKPLTYNIEEARKIRLAAEKAKVATQMGTQIHAGNNYRRVVELIQSGAIGAVHQCHVWVGRAWGRQSTESAKKHGDIVSVTDRPKQSQAIPSYLNWDLWLGPAPKRPYHSVYFPGPKWYRWWDFGNGTMSDLGSHWIDLPFWALQLDQPLTIEAKGPKPHSEIAPASMQVTYEYGKRNQLPPVSLTWYQGVEKPRLWKDHQIPRWGSGVLFIGDQGMLLADYGKHLLLPENKFQDFKRPAPFIANSIGHHAEWIHAAKTGDSTTCNFTYAGWLTEANHLGNVAFRTGKKISWDAENLRCPNAPEAEEFIKRDYRKGWNLG
ncbi:MAG: Gfo/Idh/MocA family oxidoreductase [Planctomycetota bacterium]|nr:Gfo/Idh/MocA family oxidoreductase [Planctomycetota bacterium]